MPLRTGTSKVPLDIPFSSGLDNNAYSFFFFCRALMGPEPLFFNIFSEYSFE